MHRIVKKTRKLFRDPKLYFRDMVKNRVLSDEVFSGYNRLYSGLNSNKSIFSNCKDFSVDSLISTLSDNFIILDCVDDSEYSFGVVDYQVIKIIQEIIKYTHVLNEFYFSSGMFVRLKCGGKIFLIDSFIPDELISIIHKGNDRINFSFENTHGVVFILKLTIYRNKNGVLKSSEKKLLLTHIPKEKASIVIKNKKGFYSINDIFGVPSSTQVTAPVDIVYTWVDSNDEEWKALYIEHVGDIINEDRFASRNELKFSLRSVFFYCNWVHNIYILANHAPPDWLDITHPRIIWVDHSEVLDNSNLPTFNCHAIEPGILNITGLSEKFIYFNDDVFVTRPLRKSFFFDAHGRSYAFFESDGKIAPDRNIEEESWYIARLNAQSLFVKKYSYIATRMHHHSPFSVNKSLCKEMFEQILEDVDLVSKNRLRTNDDIPLVSFLYPHYGLITGKGLEKDVVANIVNLGNYQQAKKHENMSFLCINDGVGSATDQHFDLFARQYMAELFPFSAPWEKDING